MDCVRAPAPPAQSNPGGGSEGAPQGGARRSEAPFDVLDPRALRHPRPKRSEPLAARPLRGQALAAIHAPVGVDASAKPSHEAKIGRAALDRVILRLDKHATVLAHDRYAHFTGL